LWSAAPAWRVICVRGDRGIEGAHGVVEPGDEPVPWMMPQSEDVTTCEYGTPWSCCPSSTIQPRGNTAAAATGQSYGKLAIPQLTEVYEHHQLPPVVPGPRGGGKVIELPERSAK
jgi:uncharacterized Fe-S cluster protein YjdI